MLPLSSFIPSSSPSLLPCVAIVRAPHTPTASALSPSEAAGVGVLRAARARPEAAVSLSPLTAAKLQALTCILPCSHSRVLIPMSSSLCFHPMFPMSSFPCSHSHVLIPVFSFPHSPCSHSHVLIIILYVLYICYSATQPHRSIEGSPVVFELAHVLHRAEVGQAYVYTWLHAMREKGNNIYLAIVSAV